MGRERTTRPERRRTCHDDYRNGVTSTASSSDPEQQLEDPLETFNKAVNTVAQRRILAWLAFGGMHARFDAIHPAHPKTFEWLFEDTTTSTTSTDEEEDEYDLSWARERFVDWLASGNDIFHFAGPPGSGKSTLIKFLCDHPRTQEELTKWAGMFPSQDDPGSWDYAGPWVPPVPILIAKRSRPRLSQAHIRQLFLPEAGQPAREDSRRPFSILAPCSVDGVSRTYTRGVAQSVG
jgi:hypothetical protein